MWHVIIEWILKLKISSKIASSIRLLKYSNNIWRYNYFQLLLER